MSVLDVVAKLSLDSSEYESGLKRAASFVGSGLGTVAKIGSAAVGIATTAVTGFAAASVKSGAEFDKSMSQVAATMSLTMDEMASEVGSVDLAWGKFSGNLRDYAREMGRNTAFSADEAAQALNYMALAGYDAQTSMNMLPNVLNLAAAGNFDLARASDMVTDTQTAFGISLDRTSLLVDEMAKAASTGNTSVEQLGDAFLTVGGLAQELNGGFVTLANGTQKPVDGIQELEIALVAMANAGIKGSEAGTHMRNMLLKLSSPTDAGVKQLEALGVSVFNAEGNMRSLSDIMGDLNGSLETLTQEQKIQAISDLFNTRDLASAEALLNAVGEDWDRIGASILEAEGAAQKMADTQLDNLTGDITLFKSALSDAKIAISDQLTPALRDFVKFGTDGLTELTKAFQERGLTGAMEEFGNIISHGVAKLTEAAPQAVKAGMALIGAVAQGLRDNLQSILFAAGDIVETLMNALLEATSTNDVGGGVIAQILDTFAQNYTHLIDVGFQIISNIINGITQSLPEIITIASEILQSFIQSIIDNAPSIMEAAVNMISTLATSIGEQLPDLIPMAVEAILTIVQGLVDNADQLIDGAIALIEGLAEGLINAIPVLLEKVPEIIATLIEKFIEHIPDIFDLGVTLIGAVFDGIVSIITDIPRILGMVVDAIINGFKSLFGIGGDGESASEMEGIGSGIIGGLVDGILGAIGGALELIGGAVGLIVDVIGGAWDLISGAAEVAWDGITGFLGWAWDGISSLAETVFSGIGDFIGGVWDGISSTASWAWDGITGLLGSAWDGISSLASTVFSGIGDIISSAWDGITSTASWAWDGITGLLGSAWDGITSLAGTAFDGLGSLIGSAWDGISSVASSAWDGITSGLSWAWDGITGLASDAWSGITSIIGGETEEIVKNTKEDFDAFKGLITKGIDTAVSKAKELDDMKRSASDAASGVKSAFENSDWNGVGSNMVGGIQSGMENAVWRIKDAAASAVRSAINAAKWEAEIASPSRVTRDQIGKQLSEGVAVGIIDNISSIENAMEEAVGVVSETPIEATVDMNADTSNAGSGGFVQNLTINAPQELDAWEIARQTRDANREMVLQLRTA